jgi:CheY-like chemotaxis protein
MNAVVDPPSTSLHHVILVADDDAEVRMLLGAFLCGIRPVIEACDGREAVALARRHRPALIVCDGEMPGLRARDVIAALRSDPALAQIPVIVTSGYSEAEVLGDETPIAAFLPKPFAMDELTQLVQRTLASLG